MTHRKIETLDNLQNRLEQCEKLQEKMKKVNAYFRKHKTCEGCPEITGEEVKALTYRMEHGRSWERGIPYSSYDLLNNNSQIKRLQARVKEMENGFVGWKFNGGEAIANTEIDRLQLVFDERPDREHCESLKHAGFHRAPTEGAWQRKLNSNAIYAADYLDFIRPENGERPSKLQPKAPSKIEMER